MALKVCARQSVAAVGQLQPPVLVKWLGQCTRTHSGLGSNNCPFDAFWGSRGHKRKAVSWSLTLTPPGTEPATASSPSQQTLPLCYVVFCCVFHPTTFCPFCASYAVTLTCLASMCWHSGCSASLVVASCIVMGPPHCFFRVIHGHCPVFFVFFYVIL